MHALLPLPLPVKGTEMLLLLLRLLGMLPPQEQGKSLPLLYQSHPCWICPLGGCGDCLRVGSLP